MYVSLLQHLVGKLNDEVDLTNLIQVWSESLVTKLLCFKGERTLHSSQDALELTGARKPLTDLNPQKGNYWGQRINSKWDKTIIKQRRTRTLQKKQNKNLTCQVIVHNRLSLSMELRGVAAGANPSLVSGRGTSRQQCGVQCLAQGYFDMQLNPAQSWDLNQQPLLTWTPQIKNNNPPIWT